MLAAVKAMGVGRVAVQLDDLALGHAGRLMQPVDVLGNHAGNLAPADQRRHGAMATVRPRFREHRVEREPPAPRFLARVLGGEERLEVDRGVAGSRFRRDYGSPGCPIPC